MPKTDRKELECMGINIAIDGPSGAGKSTIAKMLAAKMRYVYVDTGALYRAVAYFMVKNSTDLHSEEAVSAALSGASVALAYQDGAQRVILNGEDVSDSIRTPEISMAASAVSAMPAVREFLFALQQKIAKENNIIMDGRDIGTVVLPHADVKIFLTADAEERARRRFLELSEKGDSSTYEEVLADINQRDYNDTHRKTAPLKKADDAVEVNSTGLTAEQSSQKLFEIIQEKLNLKKPEKSKPEAKHTHSFDFKPVRRGVKLNPVKMFFYRILRSIVTLVYKITYDLHFEGKENIPKDGCNIFASNHRSYADPVLIALPTRVPFSFMAKEELFQSNIFFTALIKAFGAFPVTRGKGDTAAIDMSLERLQKGYNLVIFPEGTRSKDGTVGKGKTGVALIAAAAQVPVIPVGISFKESLKFRRKIVVKFGKPIKPEELSITSAEPRELKKLKTVIMQAITELVETDVNKL